MPFRAGSAEELAEQGDFQLLPDDEYLAEVTGFKFLPKEDQKPSQFGPTQDQYIASLKILSFADGSALEDTEGKPVDGDFILNAFINHNKMGMLPQPSKARKFFAALLQQPIGDSIEIEDPFPESLVGKQLYVATMNKKTEKGEWTRAQDYRPIKINRQRRSATTTRTTEGQQEQAETNVAVNDDDEIKF